ncbi:MAG: sigma-70 family RNA polymerase sigma factor [Candidatus Binatia bacterium]
MEPPAEVDDAALIRGTLAGRREDFDLLVERYQKPLYAFAYRLLRDHAQAADIVQVTFLQAYTHLGQFAARASFKTWLHQIALNQCRAIRRRGAARRWVRLDDVLPPARGHGLERHLAHCAGCQRCLEALREVPAWLHGLPVPDPGEEFWVQQRRAIARATGNLPPPRRRWQRGWRHDGLRSVPWRYPALAAASVLVVLLAYRFGQHARTPAPAHVQIATLDADSLAALDEVIRVMAPRDGSVLQTTPPGAATPLVLRLSGLVGMRSELAVPSMTDLTESELERVGDLIGGVG